jgi:acyl-CoA dehydrogenase
VGARVGPDHHQQRRHGEPVMRRTVFNEDHEAFRQTLREFINAEVAPNYPKWYEAGIVPREFYYKLAELGLFGIEVPEEYGGAGITSFKYSAVQTEELALAGVSFGGSGVHVALCLPYVLKLGTEEQKRRWLPGFISGETMYAIAMTEPGTGSDLAGMRTTARLSADGSHYVLNGAKTFITGGVLADRVIVCARTAPAREDDRRHGISLLVVDTSLPGYSVGRKLEKIGLKTSDTAELSFSDVRVPAEDLLGEENRGFSYLGQNLPQERLSIAYGAYAQALAAVELAKKYTQDRQVFGKSVASFQNTKFELAACKAEVDAAQAVADRALEAHDLGELTPAEAASVKLFCTEVASRVIDRCLQLHGGYGYINEYPIARLYADNRVNRIYGGTSEVMKTIIAKDMGL